MVSRAGLEPEQGVEEPQVIDSTNAQKRQNRYLSRTEVHSGYTEPIVITARTPMSPDAASSTTLEEKKLQYPKTRGIESLPRHDGYISVAVKSSDGKFSHLASIQRSQLDSIFPFFRERL